MNRDYTPPTQPAIVLLLRTRPALWSGEEDMGPDTSRWRSSETYDYLDDLIAPDLAWEWLRRNADYQSDFADSGRSAVAAQRFAALVRPRWGLLFRDRPLARRHEHYRFLDPRCRSGHSHPQSGSYSASRGERRSA